MLKPSRKRSISLAIALIFLFTVIMPVAGFAADNDYTKYSGTYNYISADDEQPAGTASVQQGVKGPNTDVSATVDRVQVKLILPSGVSFTNKPTDQGVGDYDYDKGFATVASDTYFIKSDSSSVTFRFLPSDWTSNGAKFDFSKNVLLDVDSDFTGNLDVTLEVWGLHTATAGSEAVVWSESDTVTIAKVSGSDDVMVTAGSTKSVTKGKDRKGADIRVYETKPGNLAAPHYIVYDILTDGVTFSNKTAVQAVSFKSSSADLDVTSEDGERATVKVNNKSVIFPGDIVLTPYFDIDPDVSGDIKVRVSSFNVATDGSVGKSSSEVSRTTVVPATVGDTKAVVDKLEDNDTVAYSGQLTELDVEITIKSEGGAKFKKDDTMEFTLNVGEFAIKPDSKTANADTKLYNSDKSFYVSFAAEIDKFVLSNFDIILPNDVEPGDITLAIGGDYGDLEEVTIGVAAAPVTLTAEKTPILGEALNLKAGDITITETADGALKEDGVLVLELPSGIELNGKPKLDVVEGNFDGTITVVDDKYIAIEVDKESSDASEIRLYNINYDTGRMALNGDVELKAYFIDRDVLDNENDGDWTNGGKINDTVANMIDEYDDTGVIARVANATVANDKEVVATFKVGDEGVTVLNGRTLVQVNTLCEVLGMQKSWDEATKTAYFVLNGKIVAFPMGENAIYINGTKLVVDQGGMIINNYTYATLRGIQMAFGGELTWDDTTKTATFKFVK